VRISKPSKDAFPFGECAHIVAERKDGPRGNNTLPESERNRYWNLILVCPNCHTRIDKAPEDYPVEKLGRIKHAHESEMHRLHAPGEDAHSTFIVDPPNKDSYDELLQFSRITDENWLSPDRKDYVPLGVTKEQWIAPFLEPRLECKYNET